MLGWLKDKVGSGFEAVQRASLVSDLTTHFEPLGTIKNPLPDAASRLAHFVVDGDDARILQDLKTSQAGRFVAYTVRDGSATEQARSLNGLLKTLARDVDRLVRLAFAFEAAYGAHGFYGSPDIPGFGGRCDWIVIFLKLVATAAANGETNLPAESVEAVVTANGEHASVLVSGALLVQDAQGKYKTSYWLPTPYTCFRSLEGFSGLVSRFPEIVRQSLQQTDSRARAYALTALHTLQVPVAPFLDEIAALSVAGSKEVRESAEPILKAAFDGFRPRLEASAVKGSSDERYHSVRLLARLGGLNVRPFLAQRLEAEKTSKVAEALQELLAEPKTGNSDAAVPEDFGLESVTEVPSIAPLDKQVLADLRACVAEFERKAAEEFANSRWAQEQKATRTPVSQEVADRLYEQLQDFRVTGDKAWPPFNFSYALASRKVLDNFAAHSKFELIHLVRWCLLLSGRVKNQNTGKWQSWSINYGWAESFRQYQRARKQPIDLRLLAGALRTVGVDEQLIVSSLLGWNPDNSPFQRSDPNAIWPFFAERPQVLEEALGLRPRDRARWEGYYSEKDVRLNAFKILALFHRMPVGLIPMLWEIALGSGKVERPLAQQCLDKVPGKEDKILAAATSKQQDARLAAAEWLANLKYKPAIPVLKKALAAEKSEVVRDEQIRALEALGVSLEELLDVDRLDQDAEKGLKRGIPTELQWFPFDQLPTVRWADSGKPVSPRIIEWFLIQGCRLKDAEANPSLRRYCSLFRKGDAEKLGRFVLETWIAKDTKPKYTSDEASALAQKEAAQAAAYAKQYPKYYPDFDEQKMYQAAFNRLLVQPEGSQNGTKGILALSGACCGGEVAPIVHRYVKQWFGYRGAQCKALLQVLAWSDSPSATQVVLAVANRFRTKGIQEEAMRLCQMLADRKGWTLDELADRTIPTCGLDEQCTMELDYGSRTFTVRLTAEMAIELTNQKGKAIASLPDANQSDDAEKAKAAKAALSTARKELKTVLVMQKDRLYEGLCTQRSWRFEDWDLYLRQHPIVGRYCQRLVWTVCEGERSVASFRPMADGSLTDHQDDVVTVDPTATIRLAHEQTLEADDREAWVQHFGDYKVEPLFQQFGKQTFVLSADRKEETEIIQFRGCILKAFSLRNRVTRLGYTRGASEDGGWFFDYRKSFAGLGINAVIEFTGNGVPEENRTVALQRLYFTRGKSGEGFRVSQEIPLGELPPVLLAECWNDIRMAAADGPGFAPDWQKQTEF